MHGPDAEAGGHPPFPKRRDKFSDLFSLTIQQEIFVKHFLEEDK